MNIIVKPVGDINKYIKMGINCFLLPLENYAVDYSNYYTINDIKNIRNKYLNIELFISINKNIFNNDIEGLIDVLKILSELNVKVLFYDISILKIVNDYKLNIELVWNQTHMVTNYRTINYYNSLGSKYAYLCKEITIDEIKEIIKNSHSKLLLEVVGCPSVAFSKRKLVTNYYTNLNKEKNDSIEVEEVVTKSKYLVNESNEGTSFIKKEIVNGCSIINEVKDIDYIVLKEDFIDENIFELALGNTIKYLNNEMNNDKFVLEQEKLLGSDTGFFFKKTIFKVKSND